MKEPVYQGTLQSDLDSAGFSAGNCVPQNQQDANYTFTLSDAGKHVFHTSVTSHTYTIPNNASVAFVVGALITIVNNNGAGSITLATVTDTLRRGDGTAGTGPRTIAANSMASILKTKTTEWTIGGAFS